MIKLEDFCTKIYKQDFDISVIDHTNKEIFFFLDDWLNDMGLNICDLFTNDVKIKGGETFSIDAELFPYHNEDDLGVIIDKYSDYAIR